MFNLLKTIMKAKIVKDDIYLLSVDAKDLLFEEMWEIPNGVTINSYIVKGEKTAIIDGVCGWDGVPESLFKLLDDIEVEAKDIDYVIINHMEPDHSGWLEAFQKITNDFQIYCTKKSAEILEAFFGKTENVHPVKPGEKLDLGNGKELMFVPHPNVHWPDTMMTMETSTKTLFTCDMFGSFGLLNGKHFDDLLSEEDFANLYDEEIRYFSNVMITFNGAVKKAIEKTKDLNPAIIAPGHGPVYRTKPSKIIDRYSDFTMFCEGNPLNEICVLWGSMYGMTEIAVKKALDVLEAEGIRVHNLRLPYEPIGNILSKVSRSYGLIIAAPTYENKMFPAMAATIDELGRKKITGKKALFLSSFGWAGGAKRELDSLMEATKLKWDFIDSIEFKGRPTSQDLDNVEKAVKELISLA